MLLRTLCGATLLISGVIGIATQANAGPITVPFSGTVTPKCVFGVPSDGILAAVQPNQLEASAVAGSIAIVTISCNTAATLTVGDPINTSGKGGIHYDSPYYGAYIQSGFNLANSPTAKVISWPTPSAQTFLPVAAGAVNSSIKVGMIHRTKFGAFQAGNYKFKVTLTSTP
jgi:hypothetical protein